MYSVEVTKTVNQPIDSVWFILAEEFGNINKYSEKISSVEILNNKPVGFGCIRKCSLEGGGYMTEEITKWEKGKLLELTIKDSSMPMVPGTNVVFTLTSKENAVQIKAVGNYRIKYLGLLSPLIAKKRYTKLLEYLIGLTDNH